MKQLKYLLMIFTIFFSNMTQASFGWFIAGTLMGKNSSTNNYYPSNTSSTYITMTESKECSRPNRKSIKEEKNKVAIALHLIQVIEEYKTRNNINCLRLTILSPKGYTRFEVLGTLEEFQSNINKINKKQ